MTDTLHIFFEGEFMGLLHYYRPEDRVEWVYDDHWYDDPAQFPASLSLQKKVNGDEECRHFIWGLLPDNNTILEDWGKRFHVSSRNPFDLLKHVGADCAGALQFLRPNRVDDMQSGKFDKLTPLTKKQVKERLDNILNKKTSHSMTSTGRFSLAGAQRKDALLLKGRKWHLPEGRVPTTHIIKPQTEFDHHSLNEHFCLSLAKRSGLPIPSTQLVDFDDFQAIVVKRYDRRELPDGTYTRIHQEDFCQALNIHPANKYQNEGGPNTTDIIEILRKHSADAKLDIENFIRVLTLNWAILGTDAHAKNYSLIIAKQSTFRLAPFYDIASFLPYVRETEMRHVKYAMKYGSQYKERHITADQWRTLAKNAKLKPDYVLGIAQDYLTILIKTLPKTYKTFPHKNAFLENLNTLLTERFQRCLEILNQ